MVKKYLSDYQKYLQELENIKDSNPKKTILIQACCAPCSSEVIATLVPYFDISLYYYNPNIYPEDEFEKRFNQFEKLPSNFKLIKGKYETEKYYQAVKGYENLKEFSIRCYHCFELRMEETARYAKELGYDYFSTTLSISPYKNGVWINEIGKRLEEKYDIKYLYSDFKKQEGYKKSIQLSKEYNLYRQEYCGCVYSLNERNEKGN